MCGRLFIHLFPSLLWKGRCWWFFLQALVCQKTGRNFGAWPVAVVLPSSGRILDGCWVSSDMGTYLQSDFLWAGMFEGPFKMSMHMRISASEDTLVARWNSMCICAGLQCIISGEIEHVCNSTINITCELPSVSSAPSSIPSWYCITIFVEALPSSWGASFQIFFSLGIPGMRKLLSWPINSSVAQPLSWRRRPETPWNSLCRPEVFVEKQEEVDS